MMRTLVLCAMLILGACQSLPNREPATASSPWDGQLVDLTHPFNDQTIYWPTAQRFKLEVDSRGLTPDGYYYEANTFCAAEHGGTHLDAPVHFAENGWTSDQIPLQRLIGPGVLVDVSAAASRSRDYQVTVADVHSWEQEHGSLPSGAMVLFRTGFGAYWPDAALYLGTAERGQEAIQQLHFPGLSSELARWLVAQGKISAVGIDTASIDTGQSKQFEAHQILFQANIPAFENVANLDQLPAEGFTVIALPMKIQKGSGGPLRIIALK